MGVVWDGVTLAHLETAQAREPYDGQADRYLPLILVFAVRSADLHRLAAQAPRAGRRCRSLLPLLTLIL